MTAFNGLLFGWWGSQTNTNFLSYFLLVWGFPGWHQSSGSRRCPSWFSVFKCSQVLWCSIARKKNKNPVGIAGTWKQKQSVLLDPRIRAKPRMINPMLWKKRHRWLCESRKTRHGSFTGSLNTWHEYRLQPHGLATLHSMLGTTLMSLW